jgi:hypothetical protein
MFPGGRLSGEESSWPADWRDAVDVEEIQLETRPEDPYSVNVWVVVVNGEAYIATSLLLGSEVPDEREWVRNVTADPRVRVRVEGVVYPAQLEVLDDERMKASVLAAYAAKYPESDPARGDAARFYRIVNRDGALPNQPDPR